MSGYDLVIFDWDGTLMDSTRLIASSLQSACRDVGCPVPTEDEARFTTRVSPALDFESFLETMFALASDGKTNKKGMPNPLRMAVVANAYFNDVRMPLVPGLVQKAARLGRRARPLARAARERALDLFAHPRIPCQVHHRL